MDGIYFKHFNYKQYYESNEMLGFTLAYRFLGTGEMEVAVAQCSKKDNFNKKIGRNIAAGRLIMGDSKRVIPPRVDGKLFNFQAFLRTLISKQALSFTDKNKICQKVKEF